MRVIRTFQQAYFQATTIFTPLVLALVVLSCRKKDEVPPTVSITQPTAQSAFFFGESILVSANASDDHHLEFLKVEIINSDNLPVLHSQLVQGDGTASLHLEKHIEFDDVHQESGTYYVRATASDGENLKTVFREITLYGAPLELKNVFLVRNASVGTTTLDSLDQQNNWQFCTALSLTYDVGAANSYHQYLTFTGQDFEGIESIDPDFFVSLSHIDTPYGLSTDYVEDAVEDADSHRTFICAHDGSIRSLGANGLQYGEWNSAGSFFARKILVTKDYVIAYEEIVSGLQKALSVYYKSSGQLYHSLSLSEPVIDLAMNGDQDEVLVLMNNGSESDFKLYHTSSNQLSDLDFIVSISPEAVVSGLQKNNTDVFVAHSDHIQLYHNLEASGFGFPISGVEVMRYDGVNDVLYVLTSNSIHVLNGQVSAEMYSIPVPSDAVDVMLLFNK